MKKWILLFYVFLILTNAFSYQATLGTNEIIFRLAKDYKPDAHRLIVLLNGEEESEDAIKRAVTTTDNRKTVRVFLNIPTETTFLGILKLRMVRRDAPEDDIATPLEFTIKAPKPHLHNIMPQKISSTGDNKIEWDHVSETLQLIVTGANFFPGTTGILSFKDPFLSAEEITSSTQRIEFTLHIRSGAQPGMKKLFLENHGGERDTLVFNLYSTAIPSIITSHDRPTVYAGVAQRVTAAIRSPQNIEELYIANDAAGKDQIEDAFFIIEKNIDITNNKLPLKLYILDRRYANKSLFAITKNADASPQRIGTLSNLVQIEEKYIKFKPVKKYIGEYLDAIYLEESSRHNIRLSENVDYTLLSPDNRSYPARYESSIRAIKLEEPQKLELSHQGNWRLSTRAATYAGPVWVRKIPKILSAKWIPQNPRLRELSDGKPYATRQTQHYQVIMEIQDMPVIKFPLNHFQFFDGKGTIISEPRKTYTDGMTDRFEYDMEIDSTIEAREYSIIYTPINNKILTMEFYEYNQPVKNTRQDFMTLSNPDGSTTILHLKSRKSKFIPHPAVRHPVVLRINPNTTINGNQYLNIEAKLFDDQGKQRGETFTGRVRTTKPEVRISFRKKESTGFIQLDEWDSIHLRIEHDLEKYSPALPDEELLDRKDTYSWEHTIVLEGKRFKQIIDVVTPLQQSVYIFEDDSLRASLFNVGVNALWYVRQKDNYKKFWPVSFGVGTFTSNLDRLADSQSGSIGIAGLINFDIKLVQVAFGIGRTFEYYFKNKENYKKGWHDYQTLLLQLRLPPQ